MTIYTFRTEGPFDGERERAEALITELDLSILRHWEEKDPVNPNWTMDVFTVETDILDVEVLREKMNKLVFNDKRFADLHRCAQTLAAGKKPQNHIQLLSKEDEKKLAELRDSVKLSHQRISCLRNHFSTQLKRLCLLEVGDKKQSKDIIEVVRYHDPDVKVADVGTFFKSLSLGHYTNDDTIVLVSAPDDRLPTAATFFTMVSAELRRDGTIHLKRDIVRGSGDGFGSMSDFIYYIKVCPSQ